MGAGVGVAADWSVGSGVDGAGGVVVGLGPVGSRESWAGVGGAAAAQATTIIPTTAIKA
jgi:hypothetical protein